MTQTDRIPTWAIQEAVKEREGEVLDGAHPVTTRRSNAQMAQLIEAAEHNLLLSMAASSGAGR
jgi:hypothetical protein